MIIGKNDDGSIYGVEDPRDLLKKIPDSIKSNLGITPLVEEITEEGKPCIKITVEKEDRLIDYNGRYYKRAGSTTHMVRGEELKAMILSDEKISWTDLPSEDKIDSVSVKAIEHFVNAGKSADRLPKDIEYDALGILRRYDLITKEGHLTKAAALLFGKDSSNVYNGAFVKIGEFSSDGELRREERILVPVIMQPDAVVTALYDKYIPGTFEYEGAGRSVVFRYPMTAVREATMNALIHKRYDAFEPVTIRVEPNCLTVYNPGTLPDGWTADNLKRPHASIRRNKMMAEIFHKAGYVETWGKGVNLIQRSCKENGNPEPEFTADQDGISVTFLPNRFIKNDMPGTIPANLTASEAKVCELISNNNGVTIPEMSELLGLSVRKTYGILTSLSDKGVIKRIGSRKSGSWVFVGGKR